MSRPWAQELDLSDVTEAFKDRFWSKVDRRGPDECWPWMAYCKPGGYGQFMLRKGFFVTASRVALALTTGPIPTGRLACHSCDNPPCCNPAHLFLGTQSDNLADSGQKGRANKPSGERHPNSKLTWADVEAIRAEPSRYGLHAELSRRYGVTAGNINQIRVGAQWREGGAA